MGTDREGGSESDGMVDEEQHVVLRGNLWLRLAAAAAAFPSSSQDTKGKRNRSLALFPVVGASSRHRGGFGEGRG